MVVSGRVGRHHPARGRTCGPSRPVEGGASMGRRTVPPRPGLQSRASRPRIRHASVMHVAPGRTQSSHRAPRTSRFRRARSLRGALGVTLLGAVLPGAGWLWTGRLLGYVFLVPYVAGAVYLLAAMPDLHTPVEFAVDPARLRGAAAVLGIGFGIWVLTVLTTYLWARPAGLRRTPSVLGAVVVVLGCIAVALPVVQTMRIATTQADLVDTV